MGEVVLENISKKYGDFTAVSHIDLSIKDGEFIVFVGPSGCGKSTTLRMISGLEEPSSGEIYISNRRVTSFHPKDRDIAMVFQNYSLYPHMTVYDNMAFALKLRKYEKSLIKQHVTEAAEILGINKLLTRLPGQLSGGQRQRVALGRAIVRNPQVFLLDEPLSNLDAKLRVQMRSELNRLHKHLNTTTVYVTHDQVEAMTMGERIVVMKEGTIQQVGKPEDIYRKPENTFVASFIGSPPINFFAVKGLCEGSSVYLSGTNFKLKYDIDNKPIKDQIIDQKLLLGIRPEDFKVVDRCVKGMTIPVKVDVVEMLGPEKILYGNIGNGVTVAAKVSPDVKILTGASINLAVNLDKMLLYEKVQGNLIAS